MFKKIRKNLIFLILSLGVGFFAFYYVGNTVGWNSIWESFDIFTKWNGSLIVLISFLIAFISTIRWREILKDHGVKNLNLWEMFKIYLGGFSIMYLFPIIIMGGEIFRIYSIHDKLKVPLDKAVSSVIAERILEWTFNVLVILIGVCYFFYAIATPSTNLLIVFGLAFLIVLGILIFVYSYVFNKKTFIASIVKKFNKEITSENVAIKTEKEIFKYFRNRKLWKGYFLSFLRVVVMLLRVWLIIFFLGGIVNVMSSVSILGFSYLSSIIPIPATLGSQEIIQAFAFDSLGLGAVMSTAFAMILRAGDLIISVAGLILVFGLGLRFLKKRFYEE
jgi:uncharacterized protein (TIRG00374 family)